MRKSKSFEGALKTFLFLVSSKFFLLFSLHILQQILIYLDIYFVAYTDDMRFKLNKEDLNSKKTFHYV